MSQRKGPQTKTLNRDGSRALHHKAKHDSADFHHFAQEDRVLLRSALLEWYGKNKRDLPWRRPHEKSCQSSLVPEDYPADTQRAYEVWISEIMLQQTQVKTVIPYYLRWMKAWGNIFQLAAASLDEVNVVWKGLGYYSRARRIHEAARIVVEKHGGILPRTATELEKEVPGVGRYTAGAIASIAYDEPAELVDGNVVRVLSRLRSIGMDPKSKNAIALHWELAKEILDHSQPGDFNQALMEHGATVCLPRKPLCSGCPVQTWCRAYAEECAAEVAAAHFLTSGTKRKLAVEDIEESPSMCEICGEDPTGTSDMTVTRYPVKVVKKAPRLEDTAVCIVERRGRPNQLEQGKPRAREFLLIQRPAKGLLGGLWEFPSVLIAVDETDTGLAPNYETRSQLSRAYLQSILYGSSQDQEPATKLSLIQSQDLGSVPHLFSHIKQTYWVEHVIVGEEGFALDLKYGGTGQPVHRWVNADDLEKEAISTGMKKVYALLNVAKSQAPSTKRTSKTPKTTPQRKKRKV